MNIIAIIVTYNGLEWIQKCLGSLVDSSIYVKILVIDNGSNDGTLDVIKDKFPKIEVLETEKNLGFGKANNIGLKRALKEKYDYAFLLNQDAWVESDTIESLINIHKNNEHYNILAPMQLNGSGALIDRLFLEYSVAPCRELLTDVLVNSEKQKEVYTTEFVNAACWLLPHKTLEKIGGFDPLFTHYSEDNDYINRITHHEGKVGLCSSQKVFHDREFRQKDDDFVMLTNRSYVNLLANLKNNNENQKNKFYYIKWLISHFINWIFGNNKKHYKAEFFAVVKLLKNYKRVIKHRKLCQEKNAHFIE
ncbi:glycosyltransferase family 2 protein [Flavobacteriaceae bacterium 14752]|uniref:glycosyltransferase family 2 protein n=1 Tax=Mesohalobacter salilacus TaxID=2491711 RepID=UPI000F63DEA0|nr:glycosyltransferase family 2 protein [Flavobacteriaceae bacterium 14752]